MTDKKYPLIKAAGLNVQPAYYCIGGAVGTAFVSVKAEDLEAFLAAAPKVNVWQETEYKTWHADSRTGHGETHTARLILIEPIRTETAEDLLREMVKAAQFGSRSELDAVADRAKRLLERGQG